MVGRTHLEASAHLLCCFSIEQKYTNGEMGLILCSLEIIKRCSEVRAWEDESQETRPMIRAAHPFMTTVTMHL